MKRKTSIALMGTGGYGRIYVKPLLDPETCDKHGVQLIATVDPVPSSSEHQAALQARNIPNYFTAAEMYASHRPEVVVLASPLQYHAQQTVEALGQGCHVLCEKPLCVTPDQARQMKAAKDRSANQVAIGYQWSFSAAIQQLKADILSGDFGAPRRCKSLVLWPRDEVYYTRNGWAGRRTTAAGLAVMDSPMSNACAHFLHNLLYLLGPRIDRSATPLTVAAELYRAHPIETFDTCAVRTRVTGDVELLTIFSHATAEEHEPVFEMEFERATIRYTDDRAREGRLIATFRDGTQRDYGRPSTSTDVGKLWSSIDAFNAGTPVVCGVEAATPQALVVSAANLSCPESIEFSASLVAVTGQVGQRKTAVAGLGQTLIDCYESWKLPAELGARWAAGATTVNVADLTPELRPTHHVAGDATPVYAV